MDTRRSFLARLAASVAALVAAPAVARASFDETPPAIDSHAEQLAAFDRDLGVCEDCHERVGRFVIPVEVAPRGGVYLDDDGGYEAVAASPRIYEWRVCEPCAVARARAEMVWQEPGSITLDSCYIAGASTYRLRVP